MSSQRRIDSSRVNGAKSHGPTSQAGKEASSHNAIKHGMCADYIIITGENRETYLEVVQDQIDAYNPVGEIEENIVEEMAVASWRQRRCWAAETDLFDAEIALKPNLGISGAFEALAAKPALALIHRYDTRNHLMFQRALRTLKLHRTLPGPIEKQFEPSPISEHEPEMAPEEPQPAESEALVGQPIPAAAGFQPAPRTPEAAAPTTENTPPRPPDPGGAA